MYAVELFTHESESESEEIPMKLSETRLLIRCPLSNQLKQKKNATLQFSLYQKIISSQINWPGDNISFNLSIICSLLLV